jgi:hypothetical protein
VEDFAVGSGKDALGDAALEDGHGRGFRRRGVGLARVGATMWVKKLDGFAMVVSRSFIRR